MPSPECHLKNSKLPNGVRLSFSIGTPVGIGEMFWRYETFSLWLPSLMNPRGSDSDEPPPGVRLSGCMLAVRIYRSRKSLNMKAIILLLTTSALLSQRY